MVVAGSPPLPPSQVVLTAPGSAQFGPWRITAGAGGVPVPVVGPVVVRAAVAGDRISIGAGTKVVAEVLREAGGAGASPAAGGRWSKRAWKNRLGGRNPGGAGDRRRGPDVGDEGVAVRVKSVLVTREQIATRLHELGAEITADYQGQGSPPGGDPQGCLHGDGGSRSRDRPPVDIDFMAVSSYGHATQTSGVVRILKDLDSEIAGRHVLIVEDIIDSGLTSTTSAATSKCANPPRLRSPPCC